MRTNLSGAEGDLETIHYQGIPDRAQLPKDDLIYIILVCTIPFFPPETGIPRVKKLKDPLHKAVRFSGQGYINDRCPGTSSTLYSWTSKAD